MSRLRRYTRKVNAYSIMPIIKTWGTFMNASSDTEEEVNKMSRVGSGFSNMYTAYPRMLFREERKHF